jgi:hypothetical protein
MASTLQFAEGEDRQQLTRDAEALLQQGWTLDGEGMGITKTFHFKSYFKAVVSFAFPGLFLRVPVQWFAALEVSEDMLTV